ncbi:UNVERIFIED_CONTAM: hypothetical protein PYX00_001948 [Menopon gallinae]|uniref:Uncharacterized protein n=1 Tax=Menopon gallinae TaxID=328185 RepID=A0AAW2IFP7_9NEOP
MSMFFFRLHNLRREELNKRQKKQQVNRECAPPSPSSTRSETRPVYAHYTNAIIAEAGRLFEKPLLQPSDSLDEIALQIPR